MKLCQKCGQLLAEEITSCPSCGSEVVEGRKYIDDYRIVEVLHEGYSSILCRALKDDSDEPVVIRIFTPQSGVNAGIAERLKQELEVLHELPEDYFIRHFEIRKSGDGLWYRVSESIEAENWGSLLASGRLQDYRVAFKLFARIALILEGLHRIGHFIPHLILDDIIVFKGEGDQLEVKIDYKLSRFLDPKLDRPGPMLKKLLDSHPDIVNQRPLDFRSDIWSLGKIFVELLTAEHDTADFSAEIEELYLPQEIEILFKTMLADDPGLRPRSMAEVAETLTRIDEKQVEAAMQRRSEPMPPPAREIRGLKRWVRLLVVVLVLLGLLGLVTWHYFISRQTDSEATLSKYANRYAGAVAFVLVEYRVLDDENQYYHNRSEGTAFLVDEQGYLLTNRHVACPWLEDSSIYRLINRYGQLQRPLRLEYRAFLWFEGQKAFKRLPQLSESDDLDDIYHLDRAFRTDGERRLAIVGVAKVPEKTHERIKSPLKDDFAVLKINRVPEGLNPLPLDLRMTPSKVPKLLPVIALGFPLGSTTQEAAVNVSVTRGHVRRAFENFLQVDSSLYRGNSGGPVIDVNGKVIGIASSVAMDWASAPVPVATALSDLGMILPITKAASFLGEIKAGHVKWNGVLDLSVDAKIKRITAAAEGKQWQKARDLADEALASSQDPSLIMAAAMMHFCTADYPGAKQLFSRALSMDADNSQARFMLYLIDRVNDDAAASPFRKDLLALDWRSPHEIYGYLVRVLDGNVEETSALKGGYSANEKSWLHYVVGLNRQRRQDSAGSEQALQETLLAVDEDNWVYYLALSALEKVRRQRLENMPAGEARQTYQSGIAAFEKTLEQARQTRLENQKKIGSILANLKQVPAPQEKRAALAQILAIDSTNTDALLGLIYLDAMLASWQPALDNAQKYLALQGRENRGHLQIGLLAPEILHNMGRKAQAKSGLAAYSRRTADAWYRSIAASLLGDDSEQALFEKAVESPEYTLTAYTALGFWAEGAGDRDKAISYYKEALGSYMDDMSEYEFALQRIKMLRNSQK
jgi:S1-C subfamily serine protease